MSEEVRKKQRELLQETELQRYAIAGTDQEWAAAIDAKSARGDGKILSVHRQKDSNKDSPWDAKKKEKRDKDGDDKDKRKDKKKDKKHHHHKSSKKRLKGT